MAETVTAPMLKDPALVLTPPERELPVIELCVNFGVFAGRDATSAELDALGHELLEKVGQVSIIAEQRHEIGALSEAALHQVRIEVPAEAVALWDCEIVELRGRLIEATERWALGCIAERNQELGQA
jgi:hypothetical protein